MNWSRVLQTAGIIVLLIGVGAFAIQAFPSLVGADYALIVQSGSMEPTIMTGSVVFVEEVPPETAEEGDVITFSKGRGTIPTTHRVIEKHQTGSSLRFETKGDNNESPDPEPVYRSDFIGKVIELRLPLVGSTLFTIPLIGYVVAFGQTKLGWIAMVLVPVMLLIFNELWSLYRAMEPAEENES